MTGTGRKKSIKEISPIDVYNLLPRTNCGECGEPNCMAFATRLVNGEYGIGNCPAVLTEAYREACASLKDLLAPPVRAVIIGKGDRAVTLGGKYVVYRHEFTYHNPTPIAVDVSDDLPSDIVKERVKRITEFSYNYIGRDLRLDAIAVRSVHRNPGSFASVVATVASLTDYPLVLCAPDVKVMEAGLSQVPDQQPLIYAATEGNWREMAELALNYSCPLVISAPGNLPLLRALARTLVEAGLTDLVLDPGTFTEAGLTETIHNFTAIRKAACRNHDDIFGFPLLGTPITSWAGEELSKEVVEWREAYVASMLMSRYADLLIVHGIEGWSLLPQLIWRFNIYTDPRKPVSVEPGVRSFGKPDRNSPVLITTNYALTYFTVESDIKSANSDCHLIVVDTGGISVESAVAGRYLTAESIAESLKKYNLEELVNHRVLIIPGLAARLSGEAEEVTGWKILVGPKDSSGIPQFLKRYWPPKKD